jgi:hypothetical protein
MAADASDPLAEDRPSGIRTASLEKDGERVRGGLAHDEVKAV